MPTHAPAAPKASAAARPRPSAIPPAATTGLAQEAAAGRKYDLVLADPPYAMTDYDTLARYLPRVLAEDGLLVFESDARTEPELEGLAVRTSRKYGSTRVTVFEHE